MTDNDLNRAIAETIISVFGVMGKAQYFSLEKTVRTVRLDTLETTPMLKGQQKGRGGKRGSADWKISPRDRIYG